MNGGGRVVFSAWAVLLLGLWGEAVFAQEGGSPLGTERAPAAVLSFLDSLNEMRESLAGGLAHVSQGEVTEETFTQVCKPVGMKFMQEATQRGWEAHQVSSRFRNPKHALTKEDLWVERFFLSFPFVDGIVRKRDGDSPNRGLTIYRRITVTDGCLACHGKKELRPDFIKTKYREDKAYGFSPGELRGFYKVYLP